MKRLAQILVLAPLALAACASKPKTAPIVAISSINDCALISAIGHEYYKFGPSDPARRIRLNGEDQKWTPGCDWKALGFNLVDQPAPAAADTMPVIEFRRPHYDSNGAEMRVTFVPSPGAENKELCRVKPLGDKWEVAKCGPDPKLTAPKADGPKPSDATPEKLPTAPKRAPESPIQDSQTPG